MNEVALQTWRGMAEADHTQLAVQNFEFRQFSKSVNCAGCITFVIRVVAIFSLSCNCVCYKLVASDECEN